MKKEMQKRGMILTEVLVAIGGLMTALFVLSSIMSSAWSTIAASKNMLIAQNLATEAIEGVKNLRDTNKLLEPNDKTCWLRIDPSTDCKNLAKEGGNYVVKQNSTGQWSIAGNYAQMLNINDNAGVDGVDKNYLLKISDVGGTLNGYTHDGTLGDSIYYRGVSFNVIEEDQFATFEVLVQWMEGAKVKEIKQQVTIFND